MGRTRSDNPSPNALAQRLSRQRKKQQQRQIYGQDHTGLVADSMADESVSGDICPPGLIDLGNKAESPIGVRPSGPVASLEEEQALWVRRRREITELELAKRRGEVKNALEVEQQGARLGRRFRSVLDRIPANLPGHLSPDHRTICETAIKQAVALALAEL